MRSRVPLPEKAPRGCWGQTSRLSQGSPSPDRAAGRPEEEENDCRHPIHFQKEKIIIIKTQKMTNFSAFRTCCSCDSVSSSPLCISLRYFESSPSRTPLGTPSAEAALPSTSATSRRSLQKDWEKEKPFNEEKVSGNSLCSIPEFRTASPPQSAL